MDRHTAARSGILGFVMLMPVVSSATDLWPTTTNIGLPVCVAPVDQLDPRAVADGAHGFVLLWIDLRNGAGNPDLYCRKVSAAGDTLGNPNGNVVCNAAGSQQLPAVVSDGRGGAFVAWIDLRTSGGTSGIYAQHIGGDGAAKWPANGVKIANGFNSTIGPKVCPDAAGGVYIAWRSGSGGTFLQHYDSLGVREWTPFPPAEGTLLRGGNTFPYDATPDGAGGTIVLIGDELFHVDAQRVNPAGAAQWTSGGVTVCSTPHTPDADSAVLVQDGAGGAVIAWIDRRAGNNDVYAQRLNAAGVAQWTADGVPVCAASGDQYAPLVRPLPNAEVVMIWRDFRDLGFSDIFAQRLAAIGTPLWIPDGAPVITGQPVVQRYSLTGVDSVGESFVVWNGNAAGDVFAQKLDAAGSRLWATAGSKVCDGPGDQTSSTSCVDGAGGIFVAYRDHRSQPSLYAHHVRASGYVGAVAVDALDQAGRFEVGLRCAPNPFRGVVTIQLEPLFRGISTVEVFDAGGRLVARRPVAAGAATVTWDGRDDRGRAVGAGAYWVRIRYGRTLQSARVVHLR